MAFAISTNCNLHVMDEVSYTVIKLKSHKKVNTICKQKSNIELHKKQT